MQREQRRQVSINAHPCVTKRTLLPREEKIKYERSVANARHVKKDGRPECPRSKVFRLVARQ